MVQKCCVFNCNGRYNKENKKKVFRLPPAETKRNRWSATLPRDNIPESKDTVVCEGTWRQNYAQIIVRGKSRSSTPPSVFSCVHQVYHPL